MFTDLPETELRTYRSAQLDPEDFDDFWAGNLRDARTHDPDVVLEPVDTGLTTLDVYDVTFSGYAGQRIRAWLRMPVDRTGPLPVLVEYVGYGGGRGHHLENLLWASAGIAHFQMDTRGQGSAWALGDTEDPDGSGPQIPGFMTRGIGSRETYYFRRLITDAVRAVDAARTLPEIDATRVAVYGRSQGGGVTLAVAGLVPDLALAVPTVPFLCDYPRATVITDNDPYKEIGRYLATHRDQLEQVHGTLAYFDGVNFAKRARARARFSAALMDPVCPPSTVFGAYNNYAGEKKIALWPYNAHDGGGPFDEEATLRELRSAFGM